MSSDETLMRSVVRRADHLRGKNHGLRRGQALMNALYTLSPVTYNAISGTEADCFYDDNKIPKLFQQL